MYIIVYLIVISAQVIALKGLCGFHFCKIIFVCIILDFSRSLCTYHIGKIIMHKSSVEINFYGIRKRKSFSFTDQGQMIEVLERSRHLLNLYIFHSQIFSLSQESSCLPKLLLHVS